MLIDQIRDDLLNARKERNTPKANLLGTLYSDASAVEKKWSRKATDEEVIQIVRKFIKGVDEVIAHRPSPEATAEKEWLNVYLPQQLSEQQIRTIIAKMIVDNPDISMGSLMSGLKSAYAGTLDGALASKLAKEILNG